MDTPAGHPEQPQEPFTGHRPGSGAPAGPTTAPAPGSSTFAGATTAAGPLQQLLHHLEAAAQLLVTPTQSKQASSLTAEQVSGLRVLNGQLTHPTDVSGLIIL
jgi:hypothetical protein